MEDVQDAPCKKHDTGVERESVQKLLEIDEKLSRDVFLGTAWERVGSGEVRNTPPTSSTIKSTKPRSSAIGTFENMNVEITGWFPDHKLVLRKPGKERIPKPRDSPHFLVKDAKCKTSNEQLYIFKHYKSIRKYIEEYRRQHSSVARFLSDYLMSNLPKSIYQIRSGINGTDTSGNPSHITTITSHIKTDNSTSASGSRQSDDLVSANASPNKQPDSPSHGCGDERTSYVWTSPPNSKTMSKKKDFGGDGTSPGNKQPLDPSIIFKYKLAPHYVQSLLQQHHSLQKMGQTGTTNSSKAIVVDRNNNSKCQAENNTVTGHVTPGGRGESVSSESRIHGVVTPAGSKSGQLSREGSAKQTLLSRAGGTVNLAPTKVTISSLPAVTVISKSKVPPSPLVGVDQETMTVEVKPRVNSEPATSLPGGSRKTRDNLTCLVGGEKQMWFDASGRAYVSLATRYDPVSK